MPGFRGPRRLPSDFFRTNCFASFQEDPYGMRMRDLIGVETPMWGSDYPHTESTFPSSRKILADILCGLDKDAAHLVAVANAAALLVRPALTTPLAGS